MKMNTSLITDVFFREKQIQKQRTPEHSWIVVALLATTAPFKGILCNMGLFFLSQEQGKQNFLMA